MRVLRYLLACMLVGLMGPAAMSAELPLQTLDDAPERNLSADFVHFVDRERQWEASTLAASPLQPDWVDSGGEVPNLGLLADPVWFALRLESPHKLERLAEISYSVLDDIQLHLFADGEPVTEVFTGERRPFSERPVFHRNFLIPLEFEPEREYLLLVRVETDGALHLPFTLWEERAFMEAEQVRLPLHMAFVGLMFALAVYNLLLLVAVRDIAYFWYVLVVVSSTLTQLAINGFTYQYLWPDAPAFNAISLPMSLAGTVLALGFFTDRFLNIRRTSPNTSRFCRGIGWLGVLLLAISLMATYETAIRLLIPTALTGSFVLIGIGLYLLWRGEILARFYLLALTSFMIGNVVYTLSKYGVLPHTIWTEHSIQIGHSIEVLLLSFALAYRINLERRRRLEAQQEATEKLEERVEERTAELAEAYGEVKRLSQTDGLTGAHNRMYFEECLEREWRRNARQGEPLALIILDADYFKDINDTWGHPCGDAVLRFLAESCHHTVCRPADLVARFGGEEFVILLPDTSLEGACTIAERLREWIAAHEVTCQGHGVAVTVSLGVACQVPDGRTSHEILVQQADQALYQAKEQGRNAVVAYNPQPERDPTG